MRRHNHTANGRVAHEQRRQDAALRLIERNERGSGQVDVLDARLGEGVGAARERARLTAAPQTAGEPMFTVPAATRRRRAIRSVVTPASSSPGKTKKQRAQA